MFLREPRLPQNNRKNNRTTWTPGHSTVAHELCSRLQRRRPHNTSRTGIEHRMTIPPNATRLGRVTQVIVLDLRPALDVMNAYAAGRTPTPALLSRSLD